MLLGFKSKFVMANKTSVIGKAIVVAVSAFSLIRDTNMLPTAEQIPLATAARVCSRNPYNADIVQSDHHLRLFPLISD